MAEAKESSPPLRPALRLRRAALFLLFATVLLIPKALGLRRQRHLWIRVRLVVGLLGAGLLGAGAVGFGGWTGVIAGALLVLLGVAVRGQREGRSIDAQARELAALVVLQGGDLVQGGQLVASRIFLTAERAHVLDLHHRPLLEIPLNQLSCFRAEPGGQGWRLHVEWNQSIAEFAYQGFFAEHLARIAETTLRKQLRGEPPVVKT